MEETYGSEIGSEKSLFNTRPESQGDDQDLVGFLHVTESGHQELLAGQLFLVGASLILAISKRSEQLEVSKTWWWMNTVSDIDILAQGVHEESDDDGGDDGAGEADGGVLVEVALVGAEVVLVGSGLGSLGLVGGRGGRSGAVVDSAHAQIHIHCRVVRLGRAQN